MAIEFISTLIVQKNLKSKMYVLNKHTNDNTVKVFKYKANIKFFNKMNFFLLNKKNKYSFYNFGKYVIKISFKYKKY